MSNLAFNKPVNVNPNPFGLTFYVSNTTNPTEDQGAAGTTAQGRSPKNPFTTLQAATDEAVAGRGDVVVIQRGTYTGAHAANKAGVTYIGGVSFGYPDHVVVSGITTVTASGVSFYNMEFFSNSANAVSVIVGAWSAGVNSSWFENCSFASDGTTEPEGGLIIWGGNNHTVKNCHFIDNTYALIMRSNTDSSLSHLSVIGCEFLENTTADIFNGEIAAAAATVANSGGLPMEGVLWGSGNMRIENSFFGTGAVTPTDFINIADTNGGTTSGTLAKCVFGATVHASAQITIPAGLFYVLSGAEEGLAGDYSAAHGTSGRPD